MDGRYVKHEMEIILFENDCAFSTVVCSSKSTASNNSTRIQTYSTDDPDENFK